MTFLRNTFNLKLISNILFLNLKSLSRVVWHHNHWQIIDIPEKRIGKYKSKKSNAQSAVTTGRVAFYWLCQSLEFLWWWWFYSLYFMLYRFLWALIISPTLEKERKRPKEKKMDHILQKTIKRLRWGFNTSLLGSKLGNFLEKGRL